ncbi:MAG: prephenate dehydratase [Elusimicrobiota bacterium]
MRSHIDQLDKSLLELLNKRGQLVQNIGALKQKNGQVVFSPGRERDVLTKLRAKNRGPLSPEAVESVFREVVHACRSLQKQLKVAYFGPEATFTHQAALRSFGHGAQLYPVRTIPDVFAEVEKGRADYGVVPVENSTEGIVNHTLDMFVDSTLSICAELELPIWQYLLGKAARYQGGRGVKVIFSHYQPLAQCRQWIESHLPGVRVVETSSTSEAARLASKTVGGVAIASRLAAELYGLDILASRIEDVKHNFTRFLVIGTAEPQPTGRDKTSILFSVKDRVGTLHDMLVPFKKYRLNLTKIESRPTRQRAWEYIFFVDFEGHRSEKRVQKAIQLLNRSCLFLKVLGSYPRTE